MIIVLLQALPFPIQLFVRPSLVGAIIGKGGANIRELAQSSRAHIELERRDPRSANNGRRIVINVRDTVFNK